jgi:amidophosphoribosyltransferase
MCAIRPRAPRRWSNAQPLTFSTGRGQIAIGHNGNLINAGVLRHELEQRGSIFQTDGR